MSFEEKKVPAFEHPISQLADQPNMQPGELKAYFDANPEILRQGLNGLCDALGNTTAAANLGFAQTAGVPESTVQDAIENVQSQLDAAVMGNIPSGSVTGDKLAQDVRDRFSAIEASVTEEASARQSADTAEAGARTSADANLQNQINTKCEVYVGTYVGNIASGSEGSQSIFLGFRPKALLIMRKGYVINTDFDRGYRRPCGGLIMDSMNFGCTFTDTGFTVQQHTGYDASTGIDQINMNLSGESYIYIALK